MDISTSDVVLVTVGATLCFVVIVGALVLSARGRPATSPAAPAPASPTPKPSGRGFRDKLGSFRKIGGWLIIALILLALFFVIKDVTWPWIQSWWGPDEETGASQGLQAAPAVSAARQAEIEAVRLQVFAPPVSTPYTWAEWQQILEPEHFSTRGSPALVSNLYLMQCASSFGKPEGDPGFEVPCDGTRGTPRWFRVRGLDQYGTHITFRFVRFRG